MNPRLNQKSEDQDAEKSNFPDIRKEPTEYSDPELFIRQAFAEDAVRGYELLFKRYYKQLCSHAVRFVYAQDVAEDLVIDVFGQFWSKSLHNSINTTYRSYLYASVRHAAFHYMKKNFGKQTYAEDLSELPLCSPLNTPQQELQFQELVIKIEQVIRTLSPQNQKVFLMSRFEGKRNAAIADELGISVKTVEGHITKGLSILKKALQDHGLLSLAQIFLLWI